MKLNVAFLAGAAWLVAASGSLAAPAEPDETHETSNSHSEANKIWCKSGHWTGKGPSSEIASESQLTTGWTLTSAEIAGGLLMFDYKSQDDAMNMISHFTQDQIDSYSVQITRAQSGAPLDLDITIDSESISGAGGFHQELAAPRTASLHRTGFAPAGAPGQFYAFYSGMASPVQLWITDPGVGGAPFLALGAGPEAYELRILTTVPEPASFVLGTAALLAVPCVRRRLRLG